MLSILNQNRINVIRMMRFNLMSENSALYEFNVHVRENKDRKLFKRIHLILYLLLFY